MLVRALLMLFLLPACSIAPLERYDGAHEPTGSEPPESVASPSQNVRADASLSLEDAEASVATGTPDGGTNDAMSADAAPAQELSRDAGPVDGGGATDAGALDNGVGGIPSRVVALAAGSAHTCALLGNGTIRCWGRGLNGQLGDGRSTSSSSPSLVTGITNAQAIAASGLHSCALLSDRTVRCWGWNQDGQLGDGTRTDRSTPVPVTGLTDVVEISAHDFHTCARRVDGTVFCWGANDYGELGDGTLIRRTTPVQVQGERDVLALFQGGTYHTCAARRGGSVDCWGRGSSGQLGNGAVDSHSTPVSVSVSFRLEVLGASGDRHACAVSSGMLFCWGAGTDGQLGQGTTDRSSPVFITEVPNATLVAGGSSHACAVTGDGNVYCWGAGTRGQLGDGSLTSRSTPLPIAALNVVATGLAVGDDHACLLGSNGAVYCWGANDDGQLGNGSTQRSALPVFTLPGR